MHQELRQRGASGRTWRWMAVCVGLLLVSGAAWGQASLEDYKRADALGKLRANTVFRDRVDPHWLANDSQFWYRNALPEKCKEFIFVDAAKGTRGAAFDHARLAAALAKASGEKVEADRLPFDSIEFTEGSKAVRFSAFRKRWKCDLENYAATALQDEPDAAATQPATNAARRGRRRAQQPEAFNFAARSPDGKYEAFIRDNNVYVRTLANRQEDQLSNDGTAEDSYTGWFCWSPDSKRLVAVRSTHAQEHKVYLVDSSPKDQLQPKLQTMDYLKPGDKIAQAKPQLFFVEDPRKIKITGEELFANPWSIEELRWEPDSARFTFVYNQRGHQALRVIAVDGATGQAKAIVNEESKTFIDYAGKYFSYYLDKTGEIIWMSERDGWNHLYLMDAAKGVVKNQITRGPWVVRGVDKVDEEKRQIWFRAGGIRPEQDPYYIHFCRVNFDGTGLVVLTEGDGTHDANFSNDRKYFVDTWSRVDKAPVTELRSGIDGKLICTLETADISRLQATGWQPPERFVAKGRDGTTDIYGVIYRPMNLDTKKHYPVLENIYAGPQGSNVPKAFRAFSRDEARAELGFIMVIIDGMGTSYRSKAFHDVCARNLRDAGFPDRILWMKAAAEKYPYMDTSRVGVFGGSAGGQNAMAALLWHNDFYKAAVADCGCHDNRMDKVWWNELWMGWPIGKQYEENSNMVNAHLLKGNLMLMVGELDHNVDPASTMQVVNALIKANKDFDLLISPGTDHGDAGEYGERRLRDFFVRHLLHVEPRGGEDPPPLPIREPRRIGG